MTDSLLVDAYQLDGPKRWDLLAAAGKPWIGARLKATQGTYYRTDWFAEQLAELVRAGGARAGIDWFFGCYHYLDFSLDGAPQATFLLRELDRAMAAAGLRSYDAPGLLAVMVDVERGGQRPPSLTRQHVEDVTGAFTEVITSTTGRAPTLYGGELLAALGVTSHMGCARLAIARYTDTLPHKVVTRIGWDAPDEWQYDGDGEEHLPGYPGEAPGCGKIDISVLTGSGSDAEQLA